MDSRYQGLPCLLALHSPNPGERLAGARTLVRLLAEPGQFERFCAHRVNPLLYHRLTGFRREDLGEIPHFQELRQSYLRAFHYFSVQEREIRRLVELLTGAGVEVILLKGADLRHRLYDDPAVRLMDDVDLLIAPERVTQAREILKRHNYVLRPLDLDLQPGFQERFGWVVSFDPPSGARVLVDLHWEIREVGTLYRLPYRPLRQKAIPWSVAGHPVWRLAPEHLLLHLCLHTFDEWDTGTMLKMVDLDLALRFLPLDWNFFLAEAETLGLKGPVAKVLEAMAALSPGLVPEAVLAEIKAFRPGLAERFVLRRGNMAFAMASMLALWRYLPFRDWPAYLKGKVWPSATYLEANAMEYKRRGDYLRHLWSRSKART